MLISQCETRTGRCLFRAFSSKIDGSYQYKNSHWCPGKIDGELGVGHGIWNGALFLNALVATSCWCSWPVSRGRVVPTVKVCSLDDMLAHSTLDLGSRLCGFDFQTDFPRFKFSLLSHADWQQCFPSAWLALQIKVFCPALVYLSLGSVCLRGVQRDKRAELEFRWWTVGRTRVQTVTRWTEKGRKVAVWM